jgi:D-amino peptidase
VKVFIISDIEGCAGLVKGEQTGPKGDATLYQEARKLYTEEINAAVRGAKAAGGTEIVAMDCHGAGEGYTFNSLIPEDLDPDCEFVVQDEWTEYTEFLEHGVDAALFVGMHARAGTGDGVMAHTVSGPNFQTRRPAVRGRSCSATGSRRCRSSRARAPRARAASCPRAHVRRSRPARSRRWGT